MTERELETMLAQALDHAAPDDLNGVLSRCGTRKGNVIQLNTGTGRNQKQKRPWLRGLIAACLALVLVGAGGGMAFYQQNYAVASVISLDVNPSIELKVNQNEKVLACVGVNEDAVAVLEEMDGGKDLEGAKLDVAVNAIVGALLRHGYLDDLSSAILISVEDSDQARGERLQQELTATVDGVLQTAASNAGVLTQVIAPDKELEAQAEEYGVSTGKAALISWFTDPDDPMFPNEPDAAAKLAALSVEELRQLQANGSMEGRVPIGKDAAIAAVKEYAQNYLGLTVIGGKAEPRLEEWFYQVELSIFGGEKVEVAVQAYTGELLVSSQPAAQALALRHAGVTEEQVTHLISYFDNDYRYIGFYYDGYWYNYKFHYDKAEEVLDWMKTTERTIYGDIGVDRAKAAALKCAGLTESQVTGMKVQQNWDDEYPILQYEVEFSYHDTEYHFTYDGCGVLIDSEMK